MELFGLSGPKVHLLSKKSKDYAAFMSNRDGFVTVYPSKEYGVIWLYDSLNNAKGARNLGKSKGIGIGKFIYRFEWDGGIKFRFIDKD